MAVQAADSIAASPVLPDASTRDAYRRTLLALALADPTIFCLDSDMGGLEEEFGTRLPGQYVNLGIAEANLVSVAAGLASVGKTVFVNTMATFASTRATEQVKVDVAGNGLPVKIVATHAGVAAGPLGATHWALEDVAIMRSLPNVAVVVPADANATTTLVRAAAARQGPVYVRLGRHPTAGVYAEAPPLEIGAAMLLRDGDDVTIIASGPHPVLMGLAAHAGLVERGVRARLLDMHTIKPIDHAAVVAAAAETSGIVTVEEHIVVGGLGGAVAEVVTETCPCRVVKVGMPDTRIDAVGRQHELLELGGVSSERIIAAALSLLGPDRGTAAQRGGR
jgi:transketolase